MAELYCQDGGVVNWPYSRARRILAQVSSADVAAFLTGTAWERAEILAGWRRVQIAKLFERPDGFFALALAAKRLRQWRIPEAVVKGMGAKALVRITQGLSRESCIARIAGSADPKLTNKKTVKHKPHRRALEPLGMTRAERATRNNKREAEA